LSINDEISERGVDFLNVLVKQYNEDAITDRNLVANNTKDFIDQRLEIISKELDDVESEAENYKKQNRLTDLQGDAEINLSKAEDYDKSLIAIETQLKVGQFMLSEVERVKQFELIPTDIINSTETSGEYIQMYNALILERKKSPIVQKIKILESKILM